MNTKDYLHLYLGCKIKSLSGGSMIYTLTGIGRKQAMFNDGYGNEMWLAENDYKPILRHLSDMSDEEIKEILQLTFPDNFEDKPDADEFDLEIFYNDGGNLVDADIEIGADYSCRCYEGQMAFRKDGSLHFYDESGNIELFYNQPKIFTFLLSKHFDLFGLIEAGLAINLTIL